MGVLIVDYSDLKSTISTSKSACRNIENYADSLDKKVTQKISDLGFSTSRTSDANWFARKKTENLRKKAEQYTNFAKKLEKFGEITQEKDKAVSNKFDTLYSTFKTKNNIKVNPIKEFFVNLTVGISNSSSLSRWVKNTYNNIKTSVKGVCDSVKEWFKYKGGKFVLGIVGSVAAIALGIFTICTAGLGFFGFVAIIGAGLAIINAVTNICTSAAAIKYSNSDPAMAARYGRMDTLSDRFKKTNYNSKLLNKVTNFGSIGLDTIQIFTDIVGVASIANTFFKNSKNISSIKNLFSGPEGLRTKFLVKEYKNGKEVYHATWKSFFNGLKSIKNDKPFLSNLSKNFKKDLYSDKFTIIRSFRDKKSTLSFAKDTIISSIKGNNMDKVIGRGIIKDFGSDIAKKHIPNLIKSIFKQSENNKEFDGSFRRIKLNVKMPKPITEGIRWINRIDDIMKFNEAKIINDLNISDLSNIKDIKSKIKEWKKNIDTWKNYENKKLKTTKLVGNYEW